MLPPDVAPGATAAGPPHPLAARYDAIWDAAAADVRAGRLSVDAQLARPAADPRRGATHLARSEPAVALALTRLQDALRARSSPRSTSRPPRVARLELTLGDWCQTAANTRLVETYAL